MRDATMVEARGRVVVLGAGGHAKVVIELIRSRADGLQIVGLIDRDGSPRQVLGVPVLGEDSVLPRLLGEGVTQAFVALGDNRLRQKLAARAQDLGFILVNAISPQAIVSPSARLGAGIAIMAGCVVNAEVEVGDLAIVNTGAILDHDVRIGVAAHVGPGCALAGGARVGDRAQLGAGVTAIPGVRIGADSLVGAGACVVGDIAEATLAYGVPARSVRSLNLEEGP